MHNPSSIKILKGLSLAIAAEQQAFKLLETLAFIKAVWVSQPMPNTLAARGILAELSLRSTKTINRRINALIGIKWLHKCGHGYEAISWSDLASKYHIRHKHFYYVKIQEHVKLEYILQSKVIAEKKSQCKAAFNYRLSNAQSFKDEMKPVTGSVSSEAVATHQRQFFLVGGRGYSSEAKETLSTIYLRKESKMLRGDTNVSSGTLKMIFAKRGHGSIAYKKRRLQYLGLIEVRKQTFNIDNGIHTTKASRRTRLGFVKWNETDQQLQLIQPDDIQVLGIMGLSERFLRNQGLLTRLKH
jgi:hypothetical protein